MARTGTVLVVDDEEIMREILDALLTREGYTVRLASGGAEGLDIAREVPIAAAVVDVMMPGMDGLTVLDELKKIDDDIAVIMITAFASVETAIADAIATIGENMTLRRAASLEVGKGVVSSYVHNAVIEGAGKMGVIVALESTGKTDELAAFGRQLAMHVAAANPQALDPAGLDPAVVKREKDVLADKYRQQGKPENVIEKIVESGLKTYYKEVCLLEQAFIHDNAKSVGQAVKEAEGKIGAPVKISGFVRYALGEGIEKQESDFAAEVAAASGKK